MKIRKVFLHKIFTIILIITIFIIIGCRKSFNQQNNFNSTEQVSSIENTTNDSIITNENIKLTNYDTPPSAIQNPMPLYPEKYRNSGIQGVVVLEVSINEFGIVSDIKVTKSLMKGDDGLDVAAINAVYKWKFRPATLDNKPVNSKVNIPISFSLK
jgi:TonB family protein